MLNFRSSKMKKYIFSFIKNHIKIILFLSIFVLSSNAQANKSGTIMIPKHNWHSQIVGAEIIGKLFEKVGEEVKYIEADSLEVYKLMANGEIDIVHEIWEGAFGKVFEDSLATGNVIDLVTHNAKIREDWWYPIYMESLCPGLPSWEALAECSSLFARKDSKGKGVFIGGPSDWLKYDKEKAEALGMNFEIRKMVSAELIWNEFKQRASTKESIIIFNWEPNFMNDEYEGKFIEFPKHEPECFKEVSWGINPDSLYDCAYSLGGYIKIGVNVDFEKNHPAAYKVAKQINFSTSDINRMGNLLESKDFEAEMAAQIWLEENKSKWSMWIEQ